MAMTTKISELATVTEVADSIPEIPRFLNFFLVVYLLIVGVVGFFGNLSVIAIFKKTKSLQTPGNMLIINLATSDLIMVVTQFPAMLVNTIAGTPLYGDIGCQIYAFFGAMFGVMSIATMAAISLDRYYVICNPMKATRTVTRGRSMRIIIFVWVYSLAWSLPPLMGFGRYTSEGYELSCTFDYVEQTIDNMLFVGMLFATDFILPLSLIIACYTKIIFTVRKHRTEMRRVVDLGKDDKQMSKKVSEEKKEFKIAKIGMIITSLFCLAWLPYASVAFIGQFIDHTLLNPMVQTLPAVFAKSSSILNPIVYAITHEKFKAALTDSFLNICCSQYEKDRSRMSNKGRRTSQKTLGELSTANSIDTVIGDEPKPKNQPKVQRQNTVQTTLDPIQQDSAQSAATSDKTIAVAVISGGADNPAMELESISEL